MSDSLHMRNKKKETNTERNLKNDGTKVLIMWRDIQLELV